MTTQALLFVGIDIAADTAAVAYQHTITERKDQFDIQQSAKHYRQLVRTLSKLAASDQTHVVMEATGTYWLALAHHLHQAGFHVSVINPAQAHPFARVTLRRAKTDAIDADLLCQFVQTLSPQRWTPPPAICEQLQQRLARRDDLIHMRSQERNRLHALRRHPHVEASIQHNISQHIAQLQDRIDRLDAEIQHLLHSDHAWALPARRLLTIKGIGIITAAWLLVATQAFSRCDHPEQAVAFAGLAPYAHDSGKRRGQRSVGGGGHALLRQALYMAAGSAVRYNPPVKAFYDRLLSRGKLKKVARVAAARKLLHIAWAVVVKERDFDPSFATLAA